MIAEFADRQEGVVSRAQLVARKVSKKAIDYRVGRKRLREVLPKVYAAGHEKLTRRGWLWAALLYGGPGAALSHRTAAEVRRLISYVKGHKIHVLTRRHRPEHPWLALHRSTVVTDDDIDVIDCLRVTSLERTLLDLAATESRRTVELAINEAIINQQFDLQALHAAVERFNGHPGQKALNQALEHVNEGLTPTDGEAAEALHDLLRRTNFTPRPAYQAELLGKRPDFLFEDARLIVEADGSRFHMTPMRRRKDRERDAYFRAHGYEVLRFTYAQIVYRPDYVIARIRQAIEQRTALVA